MKIRNNLFILLCVVFSFAGNSANAQSVSKCDQICGKWMSSENNLIVQVYREANEFKAKTIWFNDPTDNRDINEYYDVKNPNPALKNRRLIGMTVLENLVYVPETKSWENGTIYDATTGRIWSSAVSMLTDGTIKVTGYWKFKFIGKSMMFKRVNDLVKVNNASAIKSVSAN